MRLVRLGDLRVCPHRHHHGKKKYRRGSRAVVLHHPLYLLYFLLGSVASGRGSWWSSWGFHGSELHLHPGLGFDPHSGLWSLIQTACSYFYCFRELINGTGFAKIKEFHLFVVAADCLLQDLWAESSVFLANSNASDFEKLLKSEEYPRSADFIV